MSTEVKLDDCFPIGENKKMFNLKKKTLDYYALCGIYILLLIGLFFCFETVTSGLDSLYITQLSKALSTFLSLIVLDAVISKEFRATRVVLLLLISILVGKFHFFEQYVFEIFKKINFLNSNSQYPKLIFTSTTFIIGFLNLFLKKFSYYRLFSLFSLCIVFVTSFIFHYIVVDVGLKNFETSHYYLLDHIETDNKKGLIKDCKLLKLICLQSDKVLAKTFLEVDPFLDTFVANLPKSINDREISKGVVLVDGESRDYLARRVSFKGEENIFVYDLAIFGENKKNYVQSFYFLSACAHLFWSFFVIFLIELHGHDQSRLRLLILKWKNRR